MALIPGLSTSLSGMKTAQAQLEIISRNVANVDTPGYTRKTAQQNNIVQAGSSMGVSLGEVQRSVDEGLLKSYLSSNSLTSNYSALNTYLSKAEVLLGTPQGDGSISANVAALQAAFDTFATDTTSSAGRYNLINQADTVTSRLNYISQEIQKLRGDADVNIGEAVENINTLLDKLDNLNDQIVKYSVLGYDGTADLLDQRDDALRELSGLIDISYFKRETGAIVIQTTNGITLLDNDVHKLSHNSIAQASPTATYANGGIGGIYVDGKDITTSIKDGELKGLIDIRDTTLPSLQSQLDELAGTLMNEINQIHNMGTAYPNTPDILTGNRTFIKDAANPDNMYPQSIRIENGDVRFTIFDSQGNQVSTTTLGGNLGFTEGSISEMANTIQDWMRSANGPNLPQARVYVNDSGNLVIDTGDSNYGFSIMDEASSTPGSEQQNVTIKFDSGNNNLFDKEYEGFSSFFGLNDFFVDSQNDYIYDSKVLSPTANLGVTNPTIWSFSDTLNGFGYGTITISPNDSLSDIVNSINTNPALNNNIRASLVPNGSGYMLRIEDLAGNQLEINEIQGDNLIGRLGLEPSNVNTSLTIAVRDELKVNPGLVAGGSPQFNSSTGKYVLSEAANNIANKLGEVFSRTNDFKQSGTIAQTTTTLANYASTFVGNIATQTSNAESSLAYQEELTNSISLKEAQVSGVDIDEELGQMIIFQQTYAACAQAFTACKEILDMLLNVV